MTNSTQNIAVSVRMVTLSAAGQLHELARALGGKVSKSMLDTVINIAILEGGYSFENDQAKSNFSYAVIKNLKKDFSRDFNAVYSDRNERILL